MRYRYIQLADGRKVRFPMLGTENEPDTPPPQSADEYVTIYNSDKPCCYTCNCHHYDFDRRSLVCNVSGRCVKEYTQACGNYNPIKQGFGE